MSDLFDAAPTDSKKSAPIAYFAALQAEHEQHRHECEVRYVVNMASHEHRAVYIGMVMNARGKEAAERLRTDAWELLKRRKDESH